MKKIFLFLSVCFFAALDICAQVPQLMSYQAVIRNGSNQLNANAQVGMRISILQGSTNGATAYTETHVVNTNAQGVATLSIGGGTALHGTFAGINWANGPYFMKVETDLSGGNNYSITATSQLLSVPYAQHAATAAMATMSATAANGVPSGAAQGQVITFCDGVPTWTNGGICPGKVTMLSCGASTNTGVLNAGNVANANSGVRSAVPYTGGNGGVYSEQSINSTGVTGLTATLSAGTLALGSGVLNYTISGTPAGTGTANFLLNIGGQSCTLTRVISSAITYPLGTTHCGGNATAILNVISPVTGKIWMDRNLGASQAAIASSDASAYGDLYQWGRRADGHQCRNSTNTATLSSSDQPAHGNYILASSGNFDWRSPQNSNLWQGVAGINNPCPSTYRIPTSAELDAERASWGSNTSAGAFGSPLKIPSAGYRNYYDGAFNYVGSNGYYWSSTVNGIVAYGLYLSGSTANINNYGRAYGYSVRCLVD